MLPEKIKVNSNCYKREQKVIFIDTRTPMIVTNIGPSASFPKITEALHIEESLPFLPDCYLSLYLKEVGAN